MQIEKINPYDWPAGSQDTGFTKTKIEPNLHPENLAFIAKKLNQVIEAVNLLMGDQNANTNSK